MSQCETSCHFVGAGVSVGQDVVATVALVVVVVNEDERILGVNEVPVWSPAYQVVKLIPALEEGTDFVRESEFSDWSQWRVFVNGDAFVAGVNDFLEDEWSAATWESVSGAQSLQSSVNESQVSRPHVFGGIDTESSNTHVNQTVHHFDDLLAHMRLALVQIAKSNQFAVTDTLVIVVVILIVDSTDRGVEVPITEWNSWKATLGRVSS